MDGKKGEGATARNLRLGILYPVFHATPVRYLYHISRAISYATIFPLVQYSGRKYKDRLVSTLLSKQCLYSRPGSCRCCAEPPQHAAQQCVLSVPALTVGCGIATAAVLQHGYGADCLTPVQGGSAEGLHLEQLLPAPALPGRTSGGFDTLFVFDCWTYVFYHIASMI